LNRIETKFDDRYTGFLNFQIDGEWLDRLLHNSAPELQIEGLIPTLLGLFDSKEHEIVWDRIIQSSVCPILMCPDDCDFWCSLVVVDIHVTDNTVKWERLGIDQSELNQASDIGSEVEWLSAPSFEFPIDQYLNVISEFEIKYRHNPI
jgi:hypothetical protein